MRNTHSISVTLPITLIRLIDQTQKNESKTCSGIVAEALRQFFEWKEFKTLQRDLSFRTRARNIKTPQDIDHLIHQSR